MGLIAAVTLSHSALAEDPPAEAGVPFHGSLGGETTSQAVFPPEPGPPTGFYVLGRGTGYATHLERFTVNWMFNVTIEASGNSSATGHSHFLAANGDSLFTVSTAEATPPDENGIMTVVQTHSITPEAGTGRFAGASGSFTLTLRSQGQPNNGPFQYNFGTFEGTIILASN